MEWHYLVWKSEYELLNSENLNKWGDYSEISRSLDSILKKVTEKSLKAGHNYSFFRRFEDHVEKYKNKHVEHGEKKYHYSSSVIPLFYNSFVENIRSAPDKYDIWNHYFPSEWKITKKNLQNPENVVSLVLYNNFQQWLGSRIWRSGSEEKHDILLEEISSNLFPSLDPMLWAKILTLIFRPWVDGNRMLSLVKEGTSFGHIGRVYSGFRDSEEDLRNDWRESIKAQEHEALELALFLYGNYLTKERLGSFLKELEILKLEAGSREEGRRQEYIAIFTEMIKLTDANTKKK